MQFLISYFLTHYTLRSHTARVGYPRFEDDWRRFREEMKV